MPPGPTPALPPCALQYPSQRTLRHTSRSHPTPELLLRQMADPSSPGPRKSSDSSSPEFEFWRVRNVAEPAPILLSADELFADGVVLPLHLLQLGGQPKPEVAGESERADAVVAAETAVVVEVEAVAETAVVVEAAASTSTSTSKRWKDIFKIGEKKGEEGNERKKKERKSRGRGKAPADVNINIWPFARSHSAGTGAARPRMGGGPPRKVSSAPCSRSNSAGESKSKKWPASPGRSGLSGGVHIGRSSPVWQVRRTKPAGESTSRTSRRPADGGSSGGTNSKIRVLNLNVPLCIGYRHHLSCRSDNDGAAVGQGGRRLNAAGTGNDGAGNGTLFGLRTLFSKKVY